MIAITRAPNTGDARGDSYTVEEKVLRFLGRLEDFHVMTIRPGCVRGNHYHAVRREVLLVLFEDAWSVLWADDPSAAVQRREFVGRGVVVIEVRPGVPHAIRNDGAVDLRVVGLADIPFDPQKPDAYIRQLVSP